MKTIEKLKKMTLKGGFITRLGNILIVVFLALLMPAIIMGTYNSAKNGYKDKIYIPGSFAQKAPVYEEITHIQTVLNSLHRDIGVDNSVTVYLIEKRFDNATGQIKYYASIMANAGSPDAYRDKVFWQSQEIPEGYEYFNKEVLKRGDFLIRDIKTDPKLYVGETKLDLDIKGERSIYGKWLCKGDNEKQNFYIAVSFKFEKPMTQTPYFIYKTKQAANEITNILNR